MKELWVLIGVVSLVLGVIGIVLPILPTTPFLILTAYGFSKGNEKVHIWFMNSKIVSKFALNMEMTRTKKIILNIFVDTLLIVYIMIYKSVFVTVILITVIVIKHIVFYKYVKSV